MVAAFFFCFSLRLLVCCLLFPLKVTIEEAPDEEPEHQPTCDLFDRLQEHKNDEELMDVATEFVMQLLCSAQEEAFRRGHQVQSKVRHLHSSRKLPVYLPSNPLSTLRSHRISNNHFVASFLQIDQKGKLSLELQRKYFFRFFDFFYKKYWSKRCESVGPLNAKSVLRRHIQEAFFLKFMIPTSQRGSSFSLLSASLSFRVLTALVDSASKRHWCRAHRERFFDVDPYRSRRERRRRLDDADSRQNTNCATMCRPRESRRIKKSSTAYPRERS